MNFIQTIDLDLYDVRNQQLPHMNFFTLPAGQYLLAYDNKLLLIEADDSGHKIKSICDHLTMVFIKNCCVIQTKDLKELRFYDL